MHPARWTRRRRWSPAASATGRTIEAAAEGVVAAEPRARLEYVTVFDPDTLEPLDVLTGPARIATAVWFADIRLIDNCELSPTA